MKAFWQLNININAVDGFLYMGKLFVLLKDGTLRVLNVEQFSENYLRRVDKNPFYAERLFFNNHLIPKSEDQFYPYWKKQWDVYSYYPLTIEIDESSLPILSDIEHPVLDLKIYGQKLILATRNGVFEAPIDFSSNTNPELERKLTRVFESKATHLSAKAGEVFISSIDGLFRASYWNTDKILQVETLPIQPSSLRTNWKSYDLVNFKDPTKFEFFGNKTEVVNDSSIFAQDEGEISMKRIKEFGIFQFGSDSFLSKQIDLEEILYIFNSNTFIFVIFKDGTFKNFGVSTSKSPEPVPQSYNLPILDVSTFGKPLNALTVPSGTLLEFFDKVILAKRGVHVIESQPVSSMRTYPNSIHYKNIITTFKENQLTITALNPF